MNKSLFISKIPLQLVVVLIVLGAMHFISHAAEGLRAGGMKRSRSPQAQLRKRVQFYKSVFVAIFNEECHGFGKASEGYEYLHEEGHGWGGMHDQKLRKAIDPARLPEYIQVSNFERQERLKRQELEAEQEITIEEIMEPAIILEIVKILKTAKVR